MCRQSHPALQLALAIDSDQPLEELESHLTPAERTQSEQLPTVRRRRHFAIGRYAARAAIFRVVATFRTYPASVDIISEHEHVPRVSVDGRTDQVGLSISHSGRVAIAGAWRADDPHLVSAGVDLEYLRPNEVAESLYAFSSRERGLLARLPDGPETLGLAAWTAKEAVWKALSASQDIGPDVIDIYALALERGDTVVQVKGPLASRLGDAHLQVRTERFEGPDGMYVRSIAQVLSPQKDIAGSQQSSSLGVGPDHNLAEMLP